MAARDFTENDKAEFVNLVESAINDGIFSRTNLDTAVVHCLIFVGCQPDNWRPIIGQKSQQELDWFSAREAPRLSDGALFALSTALSLGAKGFSIDVSSRQVTSFKRPKQGETVGSYLDFKSTLGSLCIPKLEREADSLFVFAAMKPDVRVLYSDGFMAQHPDVTRQHLNKTLLPLFQKVDAEVQRDLATLLPYLTVSYKACGLSEWATRVTQDPRLAVSQPHTREWNSDRFCTEISILQSRKTDLAQWIAPSVASSLNIEAGPSDAETKKMNKTDLRLWYSRIQKDVELLCKHQPKAADRLLVLQSRLESEQQRRASVLPNVRNDMKNDNPAVRSASRLIATPRFAGLPLEEQIKRFAAYIDQEAKTTDFLGDFMVVREIPK